MRDQIRAFWNSRANMELEAGTQDVIAKQLEIEAIAGYVYDGLRILDAGCGNGVTTIELACRFNVDILGVDYAEDMIEAAQEMLQNNTALRGRVAFEVGDILDLRPGIGIFDLVYTERTIINLLDWQTQKQGITGLMKLLANDGRFVMCENSKEGLEHINRLRDSIGLTAIEPPWHNRYLRDGEVRRLRNMLLIEINEYSAMYYFLSRVVNAGLAAQAGREPEYNSLVNQLALLLPPVEFGRGQGCIWVWKNVK